MTHSSDHEQSFLNAIKAELDTSTAEMDSATVARLAQIRQAALSSSSSRPIWWIPAGAFATLAVAITVFLLWTATPVPEPNRVLEELDLLSSVDNIEFYDELDFYQWLSEDAPTG